MANCVRCGRPLPAFSIGDLREMCRECAQVQPQSAPAGAQAESQHAASALVVRSRPATVALVGINVAVFLLMVLRGVSLTQPTVEQMLNWGANWGPLALAGQPWRILTSTFLHVGIIHLALNMWCLWELGGLAEKIFGKATFVWVYLFCGLSGAIASLAWHPQVAGAGASGAIFGITGALIASFYLGGLPIPEHVLKSKLASLLLFAGYNLVYGVLKAHIDNAAHLGGFAMGLLLGAVLSRRFEARHFAFRRLVFVAAAVLLIVAGLSVRRMNAYVVHAHIGTEALKRGKYDMAIREFNAALAQKQRLAEVHYLLGNAYASRKSYREAEASYLHAIGVDPKYERAYVKLGLIYLGMGRLKPAHTVLTKALAMNASDPEAQGYFAMALENLGREDDAIAAYEKTIRMNPQYAYGYARLAIIYLKRQRPQEALAAAQKAVELQPREPDFTMLLAAAYRANGRMQEAEAALQKANELRAATRANEASSH